MVKMKYLFLDLEWNQNGEFDAKTNEILEFAVASFSEEFVTGKRFARLVKPEHIDDISNNTYRLLRISQKALAEAQSIKVILHKFSRLFPVFEVVVVWSRNTYALFLENCYQNNIVLPEHRILVLQELIQAIDSEKRLYGMEKYLKKFGIDYKISRLHFAKFDIERMRMLYLGMKKQYYTYLEDNPYHYIRSEHSSILHVKECHYAKRIKKSGMVRVEGQALFEGYAICKHCSKDFPAIQFYPEPTICSDEFVNIAQSEFDEDHINRLCQRYGLTCHISNGLIFIKSPIASWRIYHDYESVVEVFHQNMRTQKSSKARQRRPTNEGFHKQNIKENRLEAVVKYIYYHDRNFFSGKRSRKSRMEQIFEQLENVRK